MKRIILFISIILCFVSMASAQSGTFMQANDLYAKGNYAQAAKQYEKVLTNEGIAPELYYNLGNAYYKSGETAKSILNYERALRLSPYYDDARFNLELAQQEVVDNIAQSPSLFLWRWVEGLIKLLNSNQWLVLSVTVFVLSLVLAILFIFASSLPVRKVSFYLGCIFFVLAIASGTLAGVRKDQMLNHREAIVMVGTVTVKSSPDQSGTDLFQLHEGSKVAIKSTLGKWIEIKLRNGNVGWVEQGTIEKI